MCVQVGRIIAATTTTIKRLTKCPSSHGTPQATRFVPVIPPNPRSKRSGCTRRGYRSTDGCYDTAVPRRVHRNGRKRLALSSAAQVLACDLDAAAIVPSMQVVPMNGDYGHIVGAVTLLFD